MERDTRLLMNEYTERKAPSMFFYNMFVNKVKTFEQESVQIDIVRATRRMAGYNVRGAVAKNIKQKGYKSYLYTPPIINDSSVISFATARKAVAGEDIYSPLSPQARAVVHQAESAVEMSEAIDRRIEYQIYEALFTGEISIPENGGKVGFPVDTTLLDISPSASWATASTKITKDVKDTSLSVFKKSGKTPDIMVLGADALEGFLDNTQIKDQLNNRRVEGSKLDPKEIPDDATYIGYFNFEGYALDVLAYNGMYADPDTGEDTPYMPAKKALLINMAARREMLYGGIESHEATMAVPQFVDSWESKNPDGWIVRIQSAPLFAPVALDTWATIQCIPA